MFKPSQFPVVARVFIALGSCLAALLMLAPAFQGAEQGFGLSDKEAHVIAFYVFTISAFMALPKMRRNDLALAALALGAAAEVAQLLTGRSGSFADLSADAIGIAMAWAPAQIEHLRRMAREHPGLTFRQISALNRRGSPGAQTATAADSVPL